MPRVRRVRPRCVCSIAIITARCKEKENAQRSLQDPDIPILGVLAGRGTPYRWVCRPFGFTAQMSRTPNFMIYRGAQNADVCITGAFNRGRVHSGAAPLPFLRYPPVAPGAEPCNYRATTVRPAPCTSSPYRSSIGPSVSKLRVEAVFARTIQLVRHVADGRDLRDHYRARF